MCRNLELQARTERHALIRHIEQSRRDFEREIQSRRKLLATYQKDMEQRAEPPDPLLEDIERQWQRLYADYRQYRRQHGYPVPAQPQKRRTGR
ncbi:hypothetical protein PMI09_02795 [Rhizobium sp. CF122]|nr:hypothetical protein PMI09_02795 [Rhizobium sp. CF122]